MSRAIEAERLVVRRGDQTVLDLEHLRLEASQALAVVGHNGAGKTTLLEVCALLVAPSAGRLSLLGQEVFPDTTRAARLRGRVTMVLADPYLYRGTVLSNVKLALAARGVGRSERAARAVEPLDALGVARLSGQDVRTLSSGERQRVAIARAVAMRPEVLVLDEPTASVDEESASTVEDLLRELVRERGTALLFSTHSPEQASSLGDQVIRLEAGRRGPAGPGSASSALPDQPLGLREGGRNGLA